jgi:hypothetical protein
MRVCLVEGETDPAGSGGLGSSGQTFLCFVVPGQILTKYQADRALFLVRDNRYFHQVDVGRWFPSEDWVHVALQVRADGAPSLFLNREHVVSSQFKLPISEEDSWRVMLAGASVDTELLVRNLVVWRGERFDAEDPDPFR